MTETCTHPLDRRVSQDMWSDICLACEARVEADWLTADTPEAKEAKARKMAVAWLTGRRADLRRGETGWLALGIAFALLATAANSIVWLLFAVLEVLAFYRFWCFYHALRTVDHALRTIAAYIRYQERNTP